MNLLVAHPRNTMETRDSVVSKCHDILTDARGGIDPAIYVIITVRDRINRIQDERHSPFPSIINGAISDRRSSTYGSVGEPTSISSRISGTTETDAQSEHGTVVSALSHSTTWTQSQSSGRRPDPASLTCSDCNKAFDCKNHLTYKHLSFL